MSKPKPRVGAPPPRIPLESARAIAAAAAKQNHPVPSSVRAVLDSTNAPPAGAAAQPHAPAAAAEPDAPKE